MWLYASDIFLAVGIFVSTNVDDLLVVIAFFAEPKPNWRTIISGQFIGIGTLVIASALLALAALNLPKASIAYLGIFPLALGLRRLWRSLRFVPSCPRARTSSSLLTVTTVTVANGGDNITVYVPFFTKSPGAIVLYAATFALLTAVWCLLGYLLINHTALGRRLRRLGHIVLPVAMILIGLWILSDALLASQLHRHHTS
jgi:cadmium resistance protein CadD (predicted permease)